MRAAASAIPRAKVSAQVSDRLLGETDVLIAGGGIAGGSLAFELAARGVACALLEGEDPSRGASSLPAAVINAHRGRAARATALDAAGAAATLALGERLAGLGFGSGVHRGGVVRVAGSARQAETWRGRSRQGPGLEPFEAGELGPALHAPFGGARVTDGGWVEPARLLSALRSAATRGSHGGQAAVVHHGVGLLSYHRTDGARSSQALRCETSGGVYLARRLVLCLGAYDAARSGLPRLLQERGGALRVRLAEPVDGALPPGFGALAGPVCAVAVANDEVVVTGGHVAPAAEIDFAGLLSSAAWSLPALAEAEVVRTWSGVRSKRPSGTPVARRIAPSVYLFGALGGRGFLVGPLLAARLAARLATS